MYPPRPWPVARRFLPEFIIVAQANLQSCSCSKRASRAFCDNPPHLEPQIRKKVWRIAPHMRAVAMLHVKQRPPRLTALVEPIQPVDVLCPSPRFIHENRVAPIREIRGRVHARGSGVLEALADVVGRQRVVSSRVETLATLIEAVARRRLEMLRRNLPSREHGTNRARGGKIASDGCEAAHGIVDAGAEVGLLLL